MKKLKSVSWDPIFAPGGNFIAYAHDKDGHGGSEGDGGVTWYTPFLKKRLTKVFENDFINKVDIELGKKHTVVD